MKNSGSIVFTSGRFHKQRCDCLVYLGWLYVQQRNKGLYSNEVRRDQGETDKQPFKIAGVVRHIHFPWTYALYLKFEWLI